MKTILILLSVSGHLALLSFLFNPQTLSAKEQITLEQEGLLIDNQLRTWRTYVPPSYNDGRSVPLVLNFHATGSTPDRHAKYSEFEKLAEQKGFIVVSPAGKLPRASDNKITWNVDLKTGAVDDIKFIRQLINRISEQYTIDSSRVYAAGLSGGARMSSRLACDLSDKIAAIAPVAGIQYPKGCDPSRPIPVIAFHGKEDPVNQYQHQTDSAPHWKMGVEEAVTRWAANNKCSSEPSLKAISPLTTEVSYVNCAAESEVVFYSSEDTGHTWPGAPFADLLVSAGMGKTETEISATELIWAFFERHSLQSQFRLSLK